MLKYSQLIMRYSKNSPNIHSLLRYSSVPTIAEAKLQSGTDDTPAITVGPKQTLTTSIKVNSQMVAAAFEALKSDVDLMEIKTPKTDERVLKAQTIDELLLISEGTGVSRRHALKVVSVLANWCTAGKVKLADFESDPRFIRLCRVLTKGVFDKSAYSPQSEDLSTVLNVTADDEAAKLVGTITLPQMVKVISTLGYQKRRSLSLLRALAFNITGCADKLNVKESADILYSMAVLNFYDSNLLEKVCADICVGIKGDIRKSAAVGSILTSLGLLKYKDVVALDAISDWVFKNYELCRPQDIFAFIQTSAVLNHQPSNADQLFPILLRNLNYSEASDANTWLDVIWSLVLLNLATEEHLSSVLAENFVQRIEINNSINSTPAKLKLLNIDAYAAHLKNYKGPRLDSNMKQLPVARSKEKEEMIKAVVDTLKNLMAAETCLKTNINTGMGFILDAECILDNKGNPTPFSKATNLPNCTKVAFVSYDYHDMCKGRSEPSGVNVFAARMLESDGYKVLTIPYSEFRTRDKLIRRVQYIESKLKTLRQS